MRCTCITLYNYTGHCTIRTRAQSVRRQHRKRNSEKSKMVTYKYVTEVLRNFFFLRFGGTVPTQDNLLLKYSKFKMIGIIMYIYIATTFFFSYDSSGSLQRHLRIRIWKGRVMDLGFRFKVLRVFAGIDWVYFGFWKISRSFQWGWASHSLFLGFGPGGQTFLRYPEHRIILWKWFLVEANCGQFM